MYKNKFLAFDILFFSIKNTPSLIALFTSLYFALPTFRKTFKFGLAEFLKKTIRFSFRFFLNKPEQTHLFDFETPLIQ